MTGDAGSSIAFAQIGSDLVILAREDGAWRIVRGAPGFPDATVYQLDGEASHGPILLLPGDDNLVLFLNQQRQLLPGTAHFSYTLTRSDD